MLWLTSTSNTVSLTSQEVLTYYAQVGVDLIKSLVPKVTGKTAQSVRAEVKPNRLIIYGRQFFRALETGRSPRVSSKKGEFKDNLEDWLRAKGFPTKKSKTGVVYYQLGNQWFTAKSLAWKINKEGDKTFRQGGREVYFLQLEKFVQELTREVAKAKAKEFLKKIKDVTISNKAA